jgi:lysine 2,3-aminomutase
MSRWNSCWEAAPEVHVLLRESENLETAREKLISYLGALEWSYRRDLDNVKSWDYILLKEAVRNTKNLISVRNERLAETSALKHLWTAARTGDSKVEDDFIEEFVHLFKALKGQSEVYPPMFMEDADSIDFNGVSGRDAALKRSGFLDFIGKKMDSYIAKFPTGLKREIAERRKSNRKKVLDVLGADPEDWNDWKWQFRNVLKDGNGLEIIKQVINLEPDQEKGISLAIENDVPFGVTPHYLHLMDEDPSERDYAVRKQVFPPLNYVQNMMKHKEDREFAFDFMREHDTSPVDLVTRRYARVAIIKPYDSCPQICVYCQRNWELMSPMQETALAPIEKIDAALDWYAEHEEIMDVLITGGDPLVMSDDMVDHILKRLSEMPHIISIRMATRIPITVPQRITEELCEIFAKYYETGKQTMCMVTHFSHPYEVTRETAEAVRRVKMHGMHVYNQQVFTFSNSKRFETVALRIAMKKIGVHPYYCFNMKGKSEIEDYMVPIARILQERKEEARLLPGIFRTDEPVFNVPFLGKNNLRAWQDHELIAIRPDGRRVYSFHPWEKNIVKVKPYLYTDVTIKGYLNKLEERGEDPREYKSIWYYY